MLDNRRRKRKNIGNRIFKQLRSFVVSPFTVVPQSRSFLSVAGRHDPLPPAPEQVSAAFPKKGHVCKLRTENDSDAADVHVPNVRPACALLRCRADRTAGPTAVLFRWSRTKHPSTHKGFPQNLPFYLYFLLPVPPASVPDSTRVRRRLARLTPTVRIARLRGAISRLQSYVSVPFAAKPGQGEVWVTRQRPIRDFMVIEKKP